MATNLGSEDMLNSKEFGGWDDEMVGIERRVW